METKQIRVLLSNAEVLKGDSLGPANFVKIVFI